MMLSVLQEVSITFLRVHSHVPPFSHFQPSESSLLRSLPIPVRIHTRIKLVHQIRLVRPSSPGSRTGRSIITLSSSVATICTSRSRRAGACRVRTVSTSISSRTTTGCRTIDGCRSRATQAGTSRVRTISTSISSHTAAGCRAIFACRSRATRTGA